MQNFHQIQIKENFLLCACIFVEVVWEGYKQTAIARSVPVTDCTLLTKLPFI